MLETEGHGTSDFGLWEDGPDPSRQDQGSVRTMISHEAPLLHGRNREFLRDSVSLGKFAPAIGLTVEAKLLGPAQ